MKEYNFKDPRTAEVLAEKFWAGARHWPELRAFLEGLCTSNQGSRTLDPDNFQRGIKEVFDTLDSEKQQWLCGEYTFPGIARCECHPSEIAADCA